MGRVLKRVALDFKWPLKQTWEGYVNPYYVECASCSGRGYTKARLRLQDLVGLILLSGADSLRRKNHPYFINNFALHNDLIPSPDMAELTSGLAERPPSVMGHDSIDSYRATKKIIQAAGLDPQTWGICTQCKGEGISPEFLARYEAWDKTEPPKGEGYQLWENTSEGSPVSPVFKTLEELCAWCADNATTFADYKASAEEWRTMLGTGFVRHQEGNNVFI